MKKLLSLPMLALLTTLFFPALADNEPKEYLGLPGDNLNLFAVMDVFQNSETLEGFERSLNDPETIVNNLDLNGDNQVDYIMVEDYPEDNIHNIVMRVALSKTETQDVAVFVVEKIKDGSVQIQLIGDEALYGKDYIIEPNYDETPNPGYIGNVNQTNQVVEEVTVVRTTYYEVATWPLIVYISAPVYRPWRSSWGWGYYPSYWHPWTPYYYHYYYGYHYNSYRHYYAHYRPWHQHRCHRYNHYYSHIRHQSPTVIVNVNNGRYRDTYSRPEKRSEGERLYGQRVTEGKTIPQQRRVNPAKADDKRPQNSRPGSDRGQREERPSPETKNKANTDNRRPAARPDDSRDSRPTRAERPVRNDDARQSKKDRVQESKERPTNQRDNENRQVRQERPSGNQGGNQSREVRSKPAERPSQHQNVAPSREDRSKPAERSVARPAPKSENKAPKTERAAAKEKSRDNGNQKESRSASKSSDKAKESRK